MKQQDKKRLLDLGLATKASLENAGMVEDANALFADGKITEAEYNEMIAGIAQADEHECACGGACGCND